MGGDHSGRRSEAGARALTSPPRYVRLVPDIPAVHKRFDYEVPASMADAIRVGSRVRIDLHGRRVAAWVVEDGVTPPEGIIPKAITRSSGDGPPASVVSLAEWAAWRWAGPVSSFLGTASPSRTVRSSDDQDHRLGGLVTKVKSPGGASGTLVNAGLVRPGLPTVVRLAPTLDVLLPILELIHRLGPDGVVVLCPTLRRATQLTDRLRRAGAPVALMPEQWGAAAIGTCVVVGTRSAAWSPVVAIRAAVVVDAHDERYREERSPTWSAVDVLVERARRDGCPIFLMSPCPTMAMIEMGNSGVNGVVSTDRVVERRGWPTIEVIDRTGDDPRTGLFSEELVWRLHRVLDNPEGRVVCILNRTGRARLLACAHCGSLARCTKCGGAVVQDSNDAVLRCGRCSATRPAMCGQCDSTRLKLLRMGVARATEELSALTGVEAIETTASSLVVNDQAIRLMVGTEAALHRVSRADLVVFLDFDQHLLAPRFGAGEESMAMLAQAARLVGGRDGNGALVIQTRIPDHEVLLAAVAGDPLLLSHSERQIRVDLSLPPFNALATLRGAGASDYAKALRAVEAIDVSTIDSDRWLVRAAGHQQLCDGLAQVPRPAGRLRIEVDPTDV